MRLGPIDRRSKHIAVLMTCYNRVDTTVRCLRLLFAQKGDFDLSVFLVDDASPDSTGMRVETEFPSVKVIIGTGALYWCRGMNLAWRTAGNDWDAVLWLNDDVELCEGALAGILADADATGWKAAIVGSFLDGGGRMTYGVHENWVWIEPCGSPRETIGDISGNLVLIPRSVFEKVGMIADCYSHAYGDYDYSARMRKSGVKYYLASNVCGRCDDDKSADSLRRKSILERARCLVRPCGRNLKDAVLYRYKYYGLLRAIITAIHVPYIVLKGGQKK